MSGIFLNKKSQLIEYQLIEIFICSPEQNRTCEKSELNLNAPKSTKSALCNLVGHIPTISEIFRDFQKITQKSGKSREFLAKSGKSREFFWAFFLPLSDKESIDMATIKFRLSTRSDKTSGKSEILVRFYHGKSIDQYAKTNLFVEAASWNDSAERVTIPRYRVMTKEAKQTIEDLSKINTDLENIRQYIGDEFVKAGAGKMAFPQNWLSGILRKYNFPDDGGTTDILAIFDKFVEAKRMTNRRQQCFAVCRRDLHRFLIYRGISTDEALDIWDADTIQDFAEYLKNEHTFYRVENERKVKGRKRENEKITFLDSAFAKAFEAEPETRLPEERGQNTISSILSRLRAFVKWAVNNGYTTNDPFRQYSIPDELYGTPYYITIEERNRLWATDLSSRPQLAVQRDIFIFQCVVGCRVSDLQSFTKDSIINGAVEYIAKKTKDGHPDTIRVPLNPIAEEIVERYKDTPGQKLLPFISDQKYNDAIKEMFAVAGLTRMVTILNPTTREEEKRPLNEIASSHLARRTFAGNLYKKVRDPNLVGKLTGHSEGSRAFARYRDIDEDMKQELVNMLA